MIVEKYQPDACVVQCGADSIVGDPLGGTNLVPEDLAICIERVLSWNLPTLFVGGGYRNLIQQMHFKNFALFKNLKFHHLFPKVVIIFKMRRDIGHI